MKSVFQNIFLTFAIAILPCYGDAAFVFPEKWEILLPENPTAAEAFAAAELEAHLPRLPAGTASDNIFRIHLSGRGTGDNEADQANGTAGFDNYRVRITPEHAELKGINDRGVIYAAYDFLGLFGFRWLLPGPLGEVEPDTRLLSPQDRIEKPAFFIREFCTSGPESWSTAELIDWQVKNRMNRDFNTRRETAWEERGGSPLWQWIAHNYKFVLPEEGGFFEKHPDWFALYKGERIPLGNEQGNVCTTHPGLIAHFVDFIRDWFDKNPKGTAFPLSPPDGAIRWCECPDCLALGGRNFTPGAEGSMSLRQIRFVTTIAEQILQTHPDRKILLLAYQNFVDPVAGEVLPPNVLVQIVNYGAFGQPVTSPLNETQRQRIEGWAASTPSDFPSLGVWDYCLLQVDNLSGGRLVPIPVVRALHENMEFLHASGGGIFFTQSGPIQESNPFAFYAAARWAWDPTLPRRELLAEFCDAFYGAASTPMQNFWSQIESAAAKAEWNPAVWPEITIPAAKVFNPEVLETLSGFLTEASQAVAGQPIFPDRVALAQRSLDFVGNAVAQSVPWRLVRGENSYLINPEGGRSAALRVRGLRAELRNSADPDGSFHRLIFRLQPREAGMRFMENDTLRIAVLPEIGGRIIRMIDKESGWNFLDEPREDLVLDNPGAAYIHYGGYEEYAGKAFASPGWENAFRWSQEGNNLNLKSQVGDSELQRSLSIDADKPLLQITSTRSGDSKGAALRTHPVFRMPDSVDDLVLVWKNPEGDFLQQPLTQSPPREVDGVWGVFSPRLKTLLLHRFDQTRATHHLHTDSAQQIFNLELFSTCEKEPLITQSFELLRGDLQQVLLSLQ
jgi:hypothetical protein